MYFTYFSVAWKLFTLGYRKEFNILILRAYYKTGNNAEQIKTAL